MRGRRATGRRGLSGYDRDDDACWEGRARRASARGRNAGTGESIPYMRSGSGNCWCGAPFGHDWPGRAAGAPHPRDWPGRVDGHGFRS